VTDDQSQNTTIPLIRDNELRLANMRRQLERTFRNLTLVHDEISVASAAARSQGEAEIANVLSLPINDNLFSQLRSLTESTRSWAERHTCPTNKNRRRRGLMNVANEAEGSRGRVHVHGKGSLANHVRACNE
jgi:hypothetical protein